MPSVEVCQLIGQREEVKSKTEPTEIDQLVSRLTDSLRLKAKQKLKTHKQSLRHHKRPYPILLSNRCPTCAKMHCSRTCVSKYPTDSHELLKYLLKEGNLIKEAVERLHKKQFNIQDDRLGPRLSDSNQW